MVWLPNTIVARTYCRDEMTAINKYVVAVYHYTTPSQARLMADIQGSLDVYLIGMTRSNTCH